MAQLAVFGGHVIDVARTGERTSLLWQVLRQDNLALYQIQTDLVGQIVTGVVQEAEPVYRQGGYARWLAMIHGLRLPVQLFQGAPIKQDDPVMFCLRVPGSFDYREVGSETTSSNHPGIDNVGRVNFWLALHQVSDFSRDSFGNPVFAQEPLWNYLFSAQLPNVHTWLSLLSKEV